MLIVSSDGPLPLGRLEIHVSSKNKTLLSNSYRVPEETKLPTTVAIVSNGEATAEAQISVTGWQAIAGQADVPLDRRDAIVTQIPTDRVATLTVVLSARCSSKLTVSTDGSAQSSCGNGQTCDGTGNCAPAQVVASELPSYHAGDENDAGAEATTGAAGNSSGGSGDVGGNSQTVGGNSQTVGGNSQTVGGNSQTVGGDSQTLGGNAQTVGGASSTGGTSAITGGAGQTGSVGGTASTPGGSSGTSAGVGGTSAASSGSGGAISGGGTGGSVVSPPSCTALFCEDFESGKLDPTVWNIQNSGGQTAVVQKTTVAHGSYAAQFHADASVRSYDLILSKNAPAALGTHIFGRAYFQATPKPPTQRMALLFAGSAGFPNFKRLEVGSYQTGFQLTSVDQPGINADSSPATGTTEVYASGGTLPVTQWVCLEWEFNDAPDQIRVFVDGKEDETFTTIALNGVSTGQVGGFVDFGFGYYTWHPVTYAFDIFYDDIVLDTKRIGCLSQ